MQKGIANEEAQSQACSEAEPQRRPTPQPAKVTINIRNVTINVQQPERDDTSERIVDADYTEDRTPRLPAPTLIPQWGAYHAAVELGYVKHMSNRLLTYTPPPEPAKPKLAGLAALIAKQKGQLK
jgi:hypothetical protein